ncbi:MAG: hypothetical protein LCH53_11655 [Bacteroidetes bacterium]|nr:hypothetical protein [Bacteroidota bacterium]
MTLADHLADVRGRLLRNEYPNEAAVSGGIVRRVLEALGWPIYSFCLCRESVQMRGTQICLSSDQAKGTLSLGL